MKKENEIKILINGAEYSAVEKIEHVFGIIFERNLDHYQFMSTEAIKQHMINVMELVLELSKKSCNDSLIKFTSGMKKLMKFMQGVIDKVTSKDVILTYIVNLVLAQEGLGQLHGFNCAKTMHGKKITSTLSLNPEKQRMTVAKI